VAVALLLLPGCERQLPRDPGGRRVAVWAGALVAGLAEPVAELITERIRRNATELRLTASRRIPTDSSIAPMRARSAIASPRPSARVRRRSTRRGPLPGPPEDERAAAPQDPRRVRRHLPARPRSQACGRAALAAIVEREVGCPDPRPARVGNSHLWGLRWKRSPAATWCATPRWMTSSADCGKPRRSARSTPSSRRRTTAGPGQRRSRLPTARPRRRQPHPPSRQPLLHPRIDDHHLQQDRRRLGRHLSATKPSPPRSSTGSSTTPSCSPSTARAPGSRPPRRTQNADVRGPRRRPLTNATDQQFSMAINRHFSTAIDSSLPGRCHPPAGCEASHCVSNQIALPTIA
jgi:hypothetical protein